MPPFKQTIKKGTKQAIDSRLRLKSKLTKDLEIFAQEDYVGYLCQDGTITAYYIKKIKRDSDGIYSITIQALDEEGKLGNSVFDTTADKLTRFWCQPGDRVKYDKTPVRGKKSPFDTFNGKLLRIMNSAGVTIFVVQDESTLAEHNLTMDHFPYMELLT